MTEEQQHVADHIASFNDWASFGINHWIVESAHAHAVHARDWNDRRRRVGPLLPLRIEAIERYQDRNVRQM